MISFSNAKPDRQRLSVSLSHPAHHRPTWREFLSCPSAGSSTAWAWVRRTSSAHWKTESWWREPAVDAEAITSAACQFRSDVNLWRRCLLGGLSEGTSLIGGGQGG